MRFPNPKSAAVYHLPVVAGAKQPYPTTAPDLTIIGSLIPMDRKEQALEGGDYTIQSELYVEATADIRTSDKVVIDGNTYYVKSIFSAPFGGLPHRRCTLSSES